MACPAVAIHPLRDLGRRRRSATGRPGASLASGCPAVQGGIASGQDLCLLPLELLFGDDAAVTEVGQLRQLVRRAGR